METRRGTPEGRPGFTEIKKLCSSIRRTIEKTYLDSLTIRQAAHSRLKVLKAIIGYLNRLILQIRAGKEPFIQRDGKRIITPDIFLEGGQFLRQEELERFFKSFFHKEEVGLDDMGGIIKDLLDELFEIIDLQRKIDQITKKTNELRNKIEEKLPNLKPKQKEILLRILKESLEWANRLISVKKFLDNFANEIMNEISEFLESSSFSHLKKLLSEKFDLDPLSQEDRNFFERLKEYIEKKIKEIKELLPNLTNEEMFEQMNILIKTLTELKQDLESNQ